MRVLFVASEAYPLAKTGGLGDVGRALPNALTELGVDARLLMPGYPSALERLISARVEARLDGIMGVEESRLISGRLPGTGVQTWLIDAPALYRRSGSPYVDVNGEAWNDNAFRFAYLSRIGALIGLGRAAYWKADVVHANDWHTGLLPLMLEMAGQHRPASVFTVHNLAFQGNFSFDIARAIGLPEDYLTCEGCEFYGQASFLKAGIRYADRVTTVSPTYAKEVLTPDFGCGLDGLLRARNGDFEGILNGAEEEVWNPSSDPYLPTMFSPKDLSAKRVCKAEFQREIGLPIEPGRPLFGFLSRLTHQKMADVLLEALPWFAQAGAQFAAVCDGDAELEAAFTEMARKYPDNIAIQIGYEEPPAHRLYAGADMLLVPARFEPCGLSQLYAMRYGTVPVARHTGGLADTVTDTNPQSIADRSATGFTFSEPTATAIIEAMNRALEHYALPLNWRRLQLQAMSRDHGWRGSATKYLSLYRSLTGLVEPTAPMVAEPDAIVATPIAI